MTEDESVLAPADAPDWEARSVDYALQYVARWDKTADGIRLDAALEERIGAAETHFNAVSHRFSIADRAEYKKEFSNLRGFLKAEITAEDAMEMIKQIAIIEASYHEHLPEALNRHANLQVANLEKTLKVAVAVIPPEHIKEIQSIVEDAKRDLASAVTADDYDRVLAKLQQADSMMRS